MPFNLPEGTPVLDINSPTFAEDFRKAAGIGPDDNIQFVMPQFERIDGVQVKMPNFTIEDWANLPKCSVDELTELGFGIWEKDEKHIHFLFPKEWYNVIPKDLLVTYISGETGPFQPGITDDDYRFGCLAYGFIKEL